MTTFETILLAAVLTGIAYWSNKIRTRLTVPVKPTVENQTFSDQAIAVESTTYKNCKFIRCVMIYTGYEKVDFAGNTYEDCRIAFSDFAAATVLTMQNMSKNGFRQTIDDTFERMNSMQGLKTIDMEK